MLCCRGAISKYKKIEVLHCIFSDHNGMQLEIKDKITIKNYSYTWRLNNILLNDAMITEDIREEIKKFHRGK